MKCNCENTNCKERRRSGHLLGHRLGECESVATIPTTGGSICNQCARYMPLEYITGDQRLFEVEFDEKGVFTLAQLLETEEDNELTRAELEALVEGEARVFGGGAQPIGRIKRVR